MIGSSGSYRSDLRNKQGKFLPEVGGPYTLARANGKDLDRLVSRYEAETGRRPTYLVKPIHKDTWAAMQMRHELNRELEPLVPERQAANLLSHLVWSDGQSALRSERAFSAFVSNRSLWARVAIRAETKICDSISENAFKVLVDQYSREGAPPCRRIDLIGSKSARHTWLVVVMQDDTKVVHDYWTGRQTFLGEDGRFSSLVGEIDPTPYLTWMPGQTVESWASLKQDAIQDGPVRDSELAPGYRAPWSCDDGLVDYVRKRGDGGLDFYRTETDCLLTTEQRTSLGLGPDELLAYQAPDGTIFSNDVVPQAHLTPAWVREQAASFPKQHLAQAEWETKLQSACEGGEVAKVSELLASSTVRATFAKRHEVASQRALLKALDRLPVNEALVDALIGGCVDAEAGARLRVACWGHAVDKACAARDADKLANLLEQREVRSRFPWRHGQAIQKIASQSIDQNWYSDSLDTVLMRGCIDAAAIVRLTKKCKKWAALRDRWQLGVTQAVESGDAQAMTALLADPIMRANFPVRHEQWSQHAMRLAMARSPCSAQVVNTLVQGAVHAEAALRLSMIYWDASIQRCATEGNLLGLVELLKWPVQRGFPQPFREHSLGRGLCSLIGVGQVNDLLVRILRNEGVDLTADAGTGEGSPLELAKRLSEVADQYQSIRVGVYDILLKATATSAVQ